MGQRDRSTDWSTRWISAAGLLLLIACISSCRQGHWFDRPSPILSEDVAGSAEVVPELESVAETTATFEAVPVDEPLRLRNRRDLDPWDLTLQETIFLALSHAEIIRQNGQFLSPQNPLLRSPDGVSSRFDPALQASGVLFGQRGVEAALSDFDTQFTTRTIWGSNEQIQNNVFTSGGLPAGATLSEDTAQFQAALQKHLATGGQIGVSNNWNYSSNNSLGRLFPSVYEGNLRADFRQPLLAGGGTEFTRIAGPISDDIQGVTGVQQGVLIAQINSDITLTDFELNVTSFLRDVERQYWQLYLAYSTIDAELDGLKVARDVLRVVQTRSDANAPGGGAARVIEARDGVLQSQQRAHEALDSLYAAEAQLRLLMGLSVNDGCFIRPADHPVAAEISHDWCASLGAALARRPELRRQKWVVKSAELQLIAAENLVRPRLDFVASAQSNGFGNDLIGTGAAPGTTRALGSATGRLLNFSETGWTAGFEYSQPIGRRYAHTQVRNQELRLAKAMKILQAQETEVSHELAAAFRDVDRIWLALQNQRAVVHNARLRLEVARAEYEANRDGTAYLSLEALNRARDSLTQTEINLARNQIDYTQALTEVEYRCGRLLEFDNVMLTEGFGVPRPASPVEP